MQDDEANIFARRKKKKKTNETIEAANKQRWTQIGASRIVLVFVKLGGIFAWDNSVNTAQIDMGDLTLVNIEN